MKDLPKVTVNDLLDSGVHFGHKTSRWNPKMEPYIYGTKDHVHIIDLRQTVPLMQMALNKIYEVAKSNGKILFVGSKVQASELVMNSAEKCGQFYVNHRWLGGTLTNWSTMSRSIKKLDEIEKILNSEDRHESYTKKELLDLERKKGKLEKSFGGIRKMSGKPDLLVVIDTNKEHLALTEAQKLDIPIVAIVDTNSNPDNISFPIPGNDDAIRSIRLYCDLFADSALVGIKDGLQESGVDVGAAVENVGNDSSESSEAVKKLQKSPKFSKTPTAKKDK